MGGGLCLYLYCLFIYYLAGRTLRIALLLSALVLSVGDVVSIIVMLVAPVPPLYI